MNYYEKLSNETKQRIKKAIAKAVEENDEVLFFIHKCNESSVLGSNPVKQQLVPGTAEWVDFSYELGNGEDTLLLPFDFMECDDVLEMKILVHDGANVTEYNIWYHDIEEDRVYLDELDNYLD